MNKIWDDVSIDWRYANTWVPILSQWIKPFLKPPKIRGLRSLGVQNLWADDVEWLSVLQTVVIDPVDCIIDTLSRDLFSSTIVTYHACRVENAGVYHRSGIYRNNPEKLANLARQIVREEDGLAHLRPLIEDLLDNYCEWSADQGKVFLSLDDRGYTNGAGHYLLYGSEWVMGF